jgi:hypothetical protein
MSLWTGREDGRDRDMTGMPDFDHERVRGTSRKRDRFGPMTPEQIAAFARRALRIARTEIAAVSALFIVAAGVMIFVELADEMAEGEGRAFDQGVLEAMRPGAMADPWGPRRLETAAMDLTALGGPAVLLTLLVGLTRVYLAAHWATDVLAGWSVGAAWAMALWLIAYGLQRRQTSRPQAPHVLPVDEG